MINISIVIPCYNRVELLKQTIKSVEAAIKGLSAEIILVDDGSDMPISKQITEFSHLPIVNIRQKNSGLTTSRYNGLFATKGTYVQFIDSDDQIAPDKLTKQLNVMQRESADVSYTDNSTYDYLPNGELVFKYVTEAATITDTVRFYLEVQPPSHSPVFRRDYLLQHLRKPFIPLTRDYDYIGEVWFYYNLCVFPAVIVKVDQPSTYIINHPNQRLTDHWEFMGLCALLLMNRFADNAPQTALSKQAQTWVAINAFRSYRRLPYDLDPSFLNAYITLWQKVGKAKLSELRQGKYFSLVANLMGPITAAKIYKLYNRRSYQDMCTMPADKLQERLTSTLQKIKQGNGAG